VHWAAKRGDLEILSELQEAGATLDTPASFDTQMRPIHWAASDGKLKSIKFLLDNRGDINAQDGNGCSPVIIAAQYGRVETVVYLVKNGADLNQRDVNGDTALHWAAYKGFEEVCGVLMHFTPQFKDLPDNFGQVRAHCFVAICAHSFPCYLAFDDVYARFEAPTTKAMHCTKPSPWTAQTKTSFIMVSFLHRRPCTSPPCAETTTWLSS
jgi:hypothetical protein